MNESVIIDVRAMFVLFHKGLASALEHEAKKPTISWPRY